MRAISKFETLYLARSASRITDVINASFNTNNRTPPAAKEGEQVSRVIANEMDSARFDPLLSRSMARVVVKALDAVREKVESMVNIMFISSHSSIALTQLL